MGDNVFEMKYCTTKHVVVYLDRAEVCRMVNVKLKAGENELIFKDLSSFLDEDSIRVEGKGSATVSEVCLQKKHLTPEESSEYANEDSELEKRREEVDQKKEALNARLLRLRKQREVLDALADKVTLRVDSSQNNSSSFPLNSESMEGMRMFFDTYGNKSAELDESIQSTNKELSEVKQELQAILRNRHEKLAKQRKTEERELSILLDASEEGEVTLFISYVVRQAKWSPKYDIRVYSEEKVMQIMYYGLIQQATEEDWDNAKIYLSTATPSVGGTVPELDGQKLTFKQKSLPMPMARGRMMRGPPAPAPMMMAASNMAAPPVPLMDMGGCQQEAMDIQVTEVKESITSTVFEIQRDATIPADNVGHKVSIAIIDLKPEFHYECVPKMSIFAFLKAKVVNSSEYALLPGPSNIFLDNNFVSKAEVKAVSPGEEMNCSLGVDNGIKITYKPMKKHRDTSGMWNKYQHIKHTQVIEVKNNHKEHISIQITEQLPLSYEKEIKVNLVEPVIGKNQKPEVYPKLNKNNNVEWKLNVASGAEEAVTLEYTVEHPINEEIQASSAGSLM